MEKVKILFGIHCHQPVDNFHNVIFEAIEKSYKPFFKTVINYEFKFAVHFSGWLLEFIKNNDKELFNLMKKASDKGIVEFFTGGYFEPVLASIPSDDRKIQIEKLNSFIRENFGQEPKGLWLTERVWESSIVKDLVEVGIDYVMVDDYHFISNGYDKDKLHGYYITEEEGKKIKIFPIDKTLRYLTPFKPVDKVINYLKSVKSGIIFDDGEKFGIWPGTYKWVYEERWLKNFIETVLNDENIETIHYREFVEKEKPEGICYLPTTSYYEMGEWSLFTDAQIRLLKFQKFLKENGFEEEAEKFVKGGIWKNFFSKYPESNRIHKRMINLSINNKDIKNDEIFLENLLKSQCNDVLWHGIFGGLYLPNLRDNAYKYIIEAEKRVEKLKEKKIFEVKDIYFTGYDDVRFSNENFILIFSSKDGGQLTELSIKDKSFNFQNTLARRKEGYHEKILNPEREKKEREEGITTIHEMDIKASEEKRKKLIFDWYTKNSFIDHFTESIDLESFYKCSFKEIGDFANKPFYIENVSYNSLILKRNGGIYLDKKYDTFLKKIYEIEKNGINFEIIINTEYDKTLKYLLEFNFHFASLENVLLNGFKIKDTEITDTNFEIFDPYTGKRITFKFQEKTKLLTYKVETLNQSEKGPEEIVQGQSFGFIFTFNKEKTIKASLKIED